MTRISAITESLVTNVKNNYFTVPYDKKYRKKWIKNPISSYNKENIS